MKDYLLRLFAIFIIVGAGEIMLPESSIKKYAKVLMSILVFHTLLSPVGVLPEFNISAETEKVKLEDNFEEKVMAEYKKRIEESIISNGADECSVILKSDLTIEKITLKAREREKVINYIVNELGVLESDIEIRQN